MRPSGLCWVAGILCGLLGGCLAQSVLIDVPVREQGRARLATLVMREDSSVVAALGWKEGIPNADVTIADGDSGRTVIKSGRTDSLGRLALDSVVAGTYWVTVDRRLSSAEIARLIGSPSVDGFVTRQRLLLGSADATLLVGTPTSRRGSLLVSGWAFQPGYYGVDSYDFGGFLELFNSSDTTVFLDGVLTAEGSAQGIETQPVSCAENLRLLQTPDGIWARNFDRFPGRGRDYPLGSGKTVVIATDAIDHRPLFKNAIDLSHADFEYRGSSDVDNPGVPDMINLGPFAAFYGHGTFFSSVSAVVALVRPSDIDAFKRQISPTGAEYRLIPRDQLLDAIAIRYINAAKYKPCDRMVDPSIVHDDAPLLGLPPDPFLQSVNRRIYFVRPDGRPVLQNTRSSLSDLIIGERTPGRIP
jgi:hypothetical protein